MIDRIIKQSEIHLSKQRKTELKTFKTENEYKLLVDKFVKRNSFTEKERKKLTSSLKRNKLSLKYLGGKFAKNYTDIYEDILKAGFNSKDIEKILTDTMLRRIDIKRDANAIWRYKGRVREVVDTYNNRVKTLSRTFAHSIDNLINFNQSREAGIEHYKYIGNPTPEREFCLKHLGNIYHIDEIEKLDNGQGLDVMTYCGGYNCRHM